MYNPQSIEPKWQARWAELEVAKTVEDPSKPKIFIPAQFPYPSGEWLHAGHTKVYSAADIIARKKKLEGYSVLHPMGWDAFGLPAENFAIKHGVHPRVAIDKNIATFKAQLSRFGGMYDWDREINTTDADYYHWSQWIFVKLYNHFYDREMQRARPIEELAIPAGLTESAKKEYIDNHRLAFVDYKPINWCPNCKTGLANEDLEDGKCERCGSEIERKPMRQWVLRITEYGDRLVEGLRDLNWDNSMKELERDWIGRSEGCEFDLAKSGDSSKKISVYTTRVDTVYGMSYVVMAPDHPSVSDFITDAQRTECDRYISETKAKTDLDRTELNKEKTGVFTGSYVINPFNGESVPLWIADYVLGSYGTGAVMAVPAHDERDFAFAKKYNLPIKQSIRTKLLFTGENAARKEAETLYREVIDIIIENENEKFLLIYEEDPLCYHFVWGGIEKWETELEALKKELLEETGYTDYEIIWPIEGTYAWSLGYRYTKWKNQDCLGRFFHVKLKSENRISSEVDEWRHKMLWCEKEEIAQYISWENHTFAWNVFFSGMKPFTSDGYLVNSSEFTWLTSSEARAKLAEKAESEWFGRKKTNYKLRDWVFSRQRYWGEPIPMIHCEDHGFVAMREEELPLRLPEVENYQPTGTEEGPLANIEEWINTTCPICGKSAKRESNTMPQWAGSSWYWLRYMDPHNTKELVSKERENYWKAVDIYIGGVEHVTRHMIYARFWNMFLYDIGVVSVQEPFPRFQQIGLVLAEDGRKMSKRWGNIINPTDIMNEHGADTLRTYQMFMGPYDQSVAWNSNALKWVERFLERVEKLSGRVQSGYEDDAKIVTLLHKTIRKVSEDIDGFKFNTAVSALMILSNALEERTTISAETFETFLLILAPFAPHLADELYERLGHKTSLFVESRWPEYDIEKCVDDEITIAVQINGKLRGSYTFLPGVSQEEVSIIVQEKEEISKWIEWKEIVREIFVPNKLINIVVKDQ